MRHLDQESKRDDGNEERGTAVGSHTWKREEPSGRTLRAKRRVDDRLHRPRKQQPQDDLARGKSGEHAKTAAVRPHVAKRPPDQSHESPWRALAANSRRKARGSVLAAEQSHGLAISANGSDIDVFIPGADSPCETTCFDPRIHQRADVLVALVACP